MNLDFTQTRKIEDFRPLIDTLIPDFGHVFLHTIMQWCGLAHDPHAGKGQFWELFLIQKDGKTIGVCGLYSLVPQSTEELWLGWLGIIPTMRNQGHGKEVMSFLYAQAIQNGCKTLMSYVDKEGKALSFYHREGFEVIGTVRDYLKANEMKQIDGKDFEDEEDFVIRKVLNG